MLQLKKMIKPALLLFLILWALVLSGASKEEVRFSVQLYQGFRGERTDQSRGQLYTGLYQKIEIQDVISKTSISQERDRLKRIFNLHEVRIIGHDEMERCEKGRHQAGFSFSQSERIDLNLQETGITDRYMLTVKKRGAPGDMLKTELIIPFEQSAIMGFAAPDDTLLFVSLHMESGEKPVLVTRVPPVYPPELAKAGVTGKVTLEFVIDQLGKPIEIVPIDGPPEFYPVSIEALKKWRYKPFLQKGTVKPVSATVMFKFRLKEKPDEQ
jgi:protein TonB